MFEERKKHEKRALPVAPTRWGGEWITPDSFVKKFLSDDDEPALVHTMSELRYEHKALLVWVECRLQRRRHVVGRETEAVPQVAEALTEYARFLYLQRGGLGGIPVGLEVLHHLGRGMVLAANAPGYLLLFASLLSRL